MSDSHPEPHPPEATRAPVSPTSVAGSREWFLTQQRTRPDVPLPVLVERAAVIEQAIGVLMVVYGVPAAGAARLLTWRIQDTGSDARAFATRLIAELPSLPAPLPEQRAVLDRLLLTAHQLPGGDQRTR